MPAACGVTVILSITLHICGHKTFSLRNLEEKRIDLSQKLSQLEIPKINESHESLRSISRFARPITLCILGHSNFHDRKTQEDIDSHTSLLLQKL